MAWISDRLTMLVAIIIKELRQTVRDKRMMALLVAAPVIQLVMFGFAVNLDVDQVPTVVVDYDQSHLSTKHRARIFADGTLVLVGQTSNVAEAEQMLETGEAAVALIIPQGFERDIVRGRATTVQLVLDGTDPNRANVVATAVAGYFAQEGSRLVRVRAAQKMAVAQGAAFRAPSAVDVRARFFFNPSLKSATYMVPGVAAILLMLITTVVTAMGLTREREDGTLDQIMVTPVPNWVVILGKTLPFAAFGFFDFAVAVVVGVSIFDMPLLGSPPLLLLATALYLLVTLGMGLLIATSSSSQQQAFMGGFLFMLPATLLSGIMTPVQSMPGWMQTMTLINPLRHYAEVLRGVILRGARLQELVPQLTILGVMAITVVTLSTYRFSRSMR
ncbi:MAG: ABC transporter permease [Myxococcales bacterium]|nr:ABC transporter permease [Myxococcales bacterium]